jgi:hypothetical protein
LSVDNGILPCIEVRKNERVGWKKGNILRNLSVISKKNDLQKWKDSVSYGQIWIVETCSFYKEDVWRVFLFV